MGDAGDHLAERREFLRLDELTLGTLELFVGLVLGPYRLLELAVRSPQGRLAGLEFAVEMDHVLEGGQQHVQQLLASRAQLKLTIEKGDARPPIVLGGRRDAFQGPPEPANNIGRLTVLGHESVRPRLQAAQHVDGIGLTGQHHHGDVAAPDPP